MKWRVTKSEILLKTYPFNVEALHLENDKGPLSHPYHRLSSTDWVNILPVTPDRQAVLIVQPRVGNMRLTLETPGGAVDPGEAKDPMMAVVRELEEETGYTTQRVLPLGSCNPNPAIMTNRIHFFLGLNCLPNPNRQHFPDLEEDIEVRLVPVEQLDELVRTGQVDHALSALCILLSGKYLNLKD